MTPRISTTGIILLVPSLLFCVVSLFAQSAPLTFRSIVLTSTGQILNGLLTDNVFYNAFGGTLSAKRYLANVVAKPIVVDGQPPNSIWVPEDGSLKLSSFRTVEVYVNGLFYSPGQDYELFTRITPTGTELCVRVTYLVSWQNTSTNPATPYLVRFRLQP
jgi:hypothetical protein